MASISLMDSRDPTHHLMKKLQRRYFGTYQTCTKLSLSQGPSDSCTAKTIYRELSEEAKQAILEKHNELRGRVARGEETGGINGPQPAAANMRKLVSGQRVVESSGEQ